jgi:ATP-dependent DNA ligase
VTVTTLKIDRNDAFLGVLALAASYLGYSRLNKSVYGADSSLDNGQGMSTTLYKQTSSGSLRQWTITLSDYPEGGYQIIMADGQVGGKIKESKPTVIVEGKAGRTPYEQAMLQYESKVKKKLDEGYRQTMEEAENDIFVRPMLAVDFKKRGHSMDYPAIVQRKFDGVRCIAYLDDEENVILESRRGKPFPHLNHIREAIKPYLEQGRILDGELYSDDLTFQRVVGLVRKETLYPEDEKDLPLVQYRVYDAFGGSMTDKPFTERYEYANNKVAQIGSPLAITENYVVEKPEEVKTYHDQFVKEGYEGAMVRNPNLPYQMDKRSVGLQKYKDFKDDEFEIVSFTEGTGNDAGTVIWICKTANGDTFKVRPTGTRAERAKMLSDAPNLIGKSLTVRYFEMTDDNIPRFPVGVSIRDYE